MCVQHVSFVGRSKSGKTTLITRLISIFRLKSLKVGSIKHTHHQAEFDKPGKDSWRHREAGSQQVLLLSQNQLALYTERIPEQSLPDIVQKWFSDFDLVISEGFKNEPGLKIEVYRPSTGKTPLYSDPAFSIDALVSDQTPESDIPFFGFEDAELICDWILERTGLNKSY